MVRVKKPVSSDNSRGRTRRSQANVPTGKGHAASSPRDVQKQPSRGENQPNQAVAFRKQASKENIRAPEQNRERGEGAQRANSTARRQNQPEQLQQVGNVQQQTLGRQGRGARNSQTRRAGRQSAARSNVRNNNSSEKLTLSAPAEQSVEVRTRRSQDSVAQSVHSPRPGPREPANQKTPDNAADPAPTKRSESSRKAGGKRSARRASTSSKRGSGGAKRKSASARRSSKSAGPRSRSQKARDKSSANASQSSAKRERRNR